MPHKPVTIILLVALIILLALPVTAAVPPGRITVYSTPSNAQACIDGKTCDITPATFAVEGNAWHMIVVREIGYRDWVDTVYVTSDMTSTASAYLDQDPSVTAVHVNVTPGGGTICLDNVQCHTDVGKVSTFGDTVFTGVSAGYHTISVSSPAGYDDAMKLVQVKLGNTTDVVITLRTVTQTPVPVTTLTPIPDTGMVRVYVNRIGSTVCLDNTRCVHNLGGDQQQGTGTMVFDRVTANETHIVTVAAEGYEPYSSTVTVGRDLITTVDVTLRPIAGMTLTTVPATTPPVVSTGSLTMVTTVPLQPIQTRSGLDAVPVLGALALSCLILLLGKDRK
jgi:PEGA domain